MVDANSEYGLFQVYIVDYLGHKTTKQNQCSFFLTCSYMTKTKQKHVKVVTREQKIKQVASTSVRRWL